MAKAKQTKSGNWTILVYSHTDQNGKRIYQRFTAEKKREVERLAKDFEVNHKQEKKPNDMTVLDAIEKYINLKSNILSPSTIRSYTTMQKNCYPIIGNVMLNRLTNEMIQAEINQEAVKHTPKYIRNIYGLLTAALDMLVPEFNVHVSYPENRQKEIVIPSSADISLLVARSDFDELSLAIMLGAYLGLRRGEICGIHIEDINLKKRTILIYRSMVRNTEKEWIEKAPKTKSGRRLLDIPDVLFLHIKRAMIGKSKSDHLIDWNPSQITDSFSRLVKSAGVTKCTFHALRHYHASFMLANGIPNKYAMQRMGHSTENMLQRVYQHTISEKEKEVSNQINDMLPIK